MRRRFVAVPGLAVLALGVTTTVSVAVPRPSGQVEPPAPEPLGALVQAPAQLGQRADQALRAARPGAVGDGQVLSTRSAVQDRSGDVHTRFERTYRGLPVRGGDLVVHQSADGAVTDVSQTLNTPLTLSVQPKVTAAQAVSRASASMPPGAVRTGQTRPVLVVDATGASAQLAWEVTVGGLQRDGQTPSKRRVRLDATTGAVLSSVEQIVTAEGTGRSLYSGTVPLNTTAANGSFQLVDASRGGAQVRTMRNTSDTLWCTLLNIGCLQGTLLTDLDNTWGDGRASNPQSAAVDAHFGAATTWDYYRTVHGRNGIWGTGKGAVSRVHYGTKFANAFWDGTQMTYGDGDGTKIGPLVSLDIAGHEMTHGVTEHTAALEYDGESGALNEATSDIFGALIEFHARNASDTGDYIVGDTIMLSATAPLRRMDKPSADGESADCWSAGVGDLDVHNSSGVGNHFFYLLAEGSGAKVIGGKAHSSTTCNGTSLTGMGRNAAGAIWYRALSVYMTSNTDYKGARAATLLAARDLYGAGSWQYNKVAATWSAVLVNP